MSEVEVEVGKGGDGGGRGEEWGEAAEKKDPT